MRGTFLGIVQVIDVEEIRNTCIPYRTGIAQFLAGDAAIAGTDIGNDGKVLNTFIDIHKNVRISLRVLPVVYGVMSLRAAIRQCGAGACIEFAFIFAVSIVYTHSSGYIQPVKNLITQACRCHITLLIVKPEIAVSNPVRILHTKIAFALRPELDTDLSRLIPAFEVLYQRKVVSPREEISGNQRIGILSLIGHIPVVLKNITGTHIQFHLIIQETGRIAESKIITVIPVVRNHPRRINGCRREEGLILVRTGG